MAQRLERLADHLTTVDSSPQLCRRNCAGGGGRQGQYAPKLLGDAEIAEFLSKGFLKFELGASGELSDSFCEQFYRTSFDLRAAPRTELWSALTEQVNRILTTPTVRGALVSLLGPDFLVAPGNSHMHGPRELSTEVRLPSHAVGSSAVECHGTI